MVSQDFFFYSLGLGFLILVGFLSYAAYCLAQSLKKLTLILQNAEDISNDINEFEHGVKFGLLNLLHIIFKKRRGGEKMAKNKSINPVAGGVIGAAVGAAVGVAAAELTDEKKREAVGKKFEELKEEGEKVYSEVTKAAAELKGNVEDAVDDTQRKIQKTSTHKHKA